jgi:uncharacterized protein YyaL (SSP411 family)
LHAYTGDERYMKAADLTLCLFAPMMEKQPFAFAHMLEAVDLYENGPTEIALVGASSAPEFDSWLKALGKIHVTDLALYAIAPDSTDGAMMPEALRGKRQIDGRLTAYLCRSHSCSAPMTKLEELRQALRHQTGS